LKVNCLIHESNRKFLKKMEKTKSKAKAKTAVKAKKPAEAKAVTTKKASTAKSKISEADIRAKAQEIYNDRISRGEHGTPEEDWLKAEKQLKKVK
jgi:hypothetical protein